MGIIISIIMFVLTFPLKVGLKSIQLAKNVSDKKGKSNFLSRLGSQYDNRKTRVSQLETQLNRNKQKRQDKEDKAKFRRLKMLKNGLKSLILTLRLAAALLAVISSIISIIIFGLIIALLGVVGGAVLIVLLTQRDDTAIVAGLKSDELSDLSSTHSVAGGGTYEFNPSATTQDIINMSEEEIWALMSEGRFASYEEANAACKENFAAEQKFWTEMLTDVTVNRWVWADSNKLAKDTSTITFRVNRHLAQYFSDFMTDLYNCSDRFVIYSVGGFSFRTKNNGTGTSDMSAHSFGAVLDINESVDGMGSFAARGTMAGKPWATANGDFVIASECCIYGNSWDDLRIRYQLDWGGYWRESMLDPMHFSVVGDSKKGSRTYTPKYEGRPEGG